MSPTGELILGNETRRGSGASIVGIEASTGQILPGEFPSASKADVGDAARKASTAFASYRESLPETRASFLDGIAGGIADLGEELIDRVSAETGLPRGRLEIEKQRTVFQLRMMAKEVRSESVYGLRHDAVDEMRTPFRKPDLRLRTVGVGPVAVFGSSNFPLAFSVAGGDTASALAAGCPVIVKAHPAHPGTSELIGRVVQKVGKDLGLPDGVFSMLFDAGYEVGQALVADPRIMAVGFTGSRKGGLALMKIASERPHPIPVYAEMSSVNPVLLFPNALKERAASIAKDFVASVTVAAGQLCTNPGILIAIDSPELHQFISAAVEGLDQLLSQPMLTDGIRAAYVGGVERFTNHKDVQTLLAPKPVGIRTASAALFETSGAAFIRDHELQEEVFGASAIIVRCRDWDEFNGVLRSLDGQLTVTLQISPLDHERAREVLPLLETLAGRLLVNGFPTGVEVSPAMIHGGPFPATSDVKTTSVGTLAIDRFLRPIAYQDFPPELLPTSFSLAGD